MNSSKKAVALAQLVSRRYCSGVANPPSANFQSLKSKQARFQCDDGLPVFLKGGVTDKIMYQATWALILVGSGMMGKLFWDLAVPKN